MENGRQARVRFQNNNGKEGFAVELLQEDGIWGLDTWYPCVERKDHGDGRTDYLHWTILRKLSELQDLGYTVSILQSA